MQQYIQREIQEHLETLQRLQREHAGVIERIAHKFVETFRRGGKILFCGNGGSAADAQHLAAELVIRLRGHFSRPSLPAIALTTDTSILTAGANDLGFEQVFARQIEALGNAGDLLVAISTSGNSPNVLQAIETAHQRGLFVVGFTGGSGGRMIHQVDIALVIPSETTARIQEGHILAGHIICQLTEEMLFSDDADASSS
ncbi:MAG: D-sedoheptulose 7-phosphate isomerase [Calditrichaeota bacterium]|nr:D-sedoheptulose 7-phosphate isomerase [Calditrichota bacterium]